MLLDKLKQDLLRSCRNYLVKSNRFAPMFHLNCSIYRLVEYFIKKRLSSVPGVISVYMMHGLALGELYPGLSDFDIAIIFETSNVREFYSSVRSIWKSLNKLLPVRDISLFTKQEFTLWQKYGGWDPLDELKHWKCIYGEDLRNGNWDLNSLSAERDRLRHVLARFQKLFSSIIKEEPNTPYHAISARRNIYKDFCSSIVLLDQKYFSIDKQFLRLSQWMKDTGNNTAAVELLLKMQKERFFTGFISKIRFSIGAVAYQLLNEALKELNSYHHPLVNPTICNKIKIPPYNLPEVEGRITKLSSSIVGLLGERLESIMLISTGSTRGYILLVIPVDDLSVYEIEEVLRNLHMIFRIYDDPWFNEHFPSKIPIVYSRNMFLAHLAVWPYDRNYTNYHRRVLYGIDLYKEINLEPADANNENRHVEEMIREKVNLTIYLHQTYLERSKPALYDAVTLYLPRLYSLQKMLFAPTTAEEAVSWYEELNHSEAVNLPLVFYERYAKKGIYSLSRDMTDDEFDDAWSLWRNFFTSNHLPE
jgi:hypothetical protein